MDTLAEITFDDGTKIYVEVSGNLPAGEGRQLASGDFAAKVTAKFDNVGGAIRNLAAQVRDAVRACAPASTEVEFCLGVKVESSELFAVLAKGSADASLKVKLHWEGDSAAQ